MSTKSQLIKQVSKETGYSANICSCIVESFIELIKKDLMNNETVVLKNFGKLEQVKVKKRERYNPFKEEKYMEPEHNTIKFKCSKTFYKETIYDSKRNRGNQC